MATQDPRAREEAGGLTALPRIEELTSSDGGYDQAQVQQAFESFRRHITQLQTQLRVLQAAGRGSEAEPSGHAVRMDALHLIRAAAEFADELEKDAQGAAARQIRRAESEIADKQREFQKQELQIEQKRQEAERRRNELLNEARKEARELADKSDREATQKVQEAEARGARLLEQARHQATELTNSARAEIDQSLEWARSQATDVVQRARAAAEQLLGAAGLGGKALEKVVNSIAGEGPPSDASSSAAEGQASSSAEARSSGRTQPSGTPPTGESRPSGSAE